MRDLALWRPVDLAKCPNDYARVDMKKVFNVALAGLSPDVRKAADSTSTGPLIRQDLEANIYELFVKKFPFFDMISKIPSNGLVHSYDQQTSFGDALFQTELGVVTDDAAVYARQTAPISVIATRRGISLKAQYAVAAGGMNYDPEAREISSGLTALRNKLQNAMFRLQASDNTSVTATAANGLYDANAFSGLRYTLANLSPGANTINVDVRTAYTDNRVTKAVRKAANTIIDAGGEPDLIVGSISGREYVIAEQLPQVRFDTSNTTEVIPGVRVPKIAAGEAEMPVVVIPGGAVGTYVIGTATYVDLYVVDSSTLALAYLGGPTPTVLEIPIGTDGTLRKLYIPFMMAGLVCHVPMWMARVQMQIA